MYEAALDKVDIVALDITYLLEKNRLDLDAAKHVLWVVLFSIYEYECLEKVKHKQDVSDNGL